MTLKKQTDSKLESARDLLLWGNTDSSSSDEWLVLIIPLQTPNERKAHQSTDVPDNGARMTISLYAQLCDFCYLITLNYFASNFLFLFLILILIRLPGGAGARRAK